MRVHYYHWMCTIIVNIKPTTIIVSVIVATTTIIEYFAYFTFIETLDSDIDAIK